MQLLVDTLHLGASGPLMTGRYNHQPFDLMCVQDGLSGTCSMWMSLHCFVIQFVQIIWQDT